MIAHALTLVIFAAEPGAPSLASRVSQPSDHVVGGALAPAALPAGTLAFWGLLGAPDIGVGYRQGLSSIELEARALLNYLKLSAIFEIGVRVPLYHRERLQIAPLAALGLELNSGSTYFDAANFASVALRPRLGAVASYLVSDTAQVLFTAEVPWAISLNVAGSHVVPTVGAGAEFHVGGKLSVLALGQLGVDVIKEPLGVTQVRAAWAIRLGFGYRVF